MMFEFLIATASSAMSFGGPAEIWGHIVNDFSNLNTTSAWTALGSVILLDLVLAGDNAIVVGALAAGLPPEQRKKVIFIGVIAALVLRVVFALMVNLLMGVIGLIFVGGLLLIWVAWKMYRDLQRSEATESPGSPEVLGDENSGIPAAKSFAAAAWALAATSSR